jgi:VanZ like family
MTSVSVRLLIVWLLCVAAGTLAPFDLAAGAGSAGSLKLLEYGAHGNAVHFALNILLFMPLGVLLHHRQRQSASLVRITTFAVAAGLSISLVIESLQAFLPTRDSSLVDVLSNTIGALAGVMADRRFGPAIEARFSDVRSATSPTRLAGTVGSLLVVALLISGTLQARTRLSNWNPEYPLLIGNELTGDRPWRGRVFALEITDGATPAPLVHRFSNGSSVTLPGEPIASFTFTGSAPYVDASGHLPDLEWTAQPRTSVHTGVWLSGPSWLQSDRAAARLAQRLGKTNAFSLRVTCATDDVEQDGPARIVSSSVSPLSRNFTVGQERRDLVFRLRTPETGDNGYPLEVIVPGIFADRQPREILATYDGAALLVTMAHSDAVSSTRLTPGSGVALAVRNLSVRADELHVWEMIYVAMLSLIPGALIGLLGHTSVQRWVLSAAWVLAFAVALEVTIVRVSGSAFVWSDVGQAAAVGAVVLAVFNVIFFSADVEWPRPLHVRAGMARRKALNFYTARRTTT